MKIEVNVKKNIELEHGMIFSQKGKYSSSANIFMLANVGYNVDICDDEFVLLHIDGKGMKWTTPTTLDEVAKDIQDPEFGFAYLGNITDYTKDIIEEE